ncbi:hypothetical protein C3L33_10601, partial [Rhododendron williamsianum]
MKRVDVIVTVLQRGHVVTGFWSQCCSISSSSSPCCSFESSSSIRGIKLSTRGSSIFTFNPPMPEANALHNWNMNGPTGRETGAETPLQNYTMGKTLGHGSFGKVKITEHQPTRLFVHPHIIRLYEVIETLTDIYVVMEYVKSGELFDYIVEKRRLLEDEARSFF